MRAKPEAVAITDGGCGGGRNFRPRRNYFRRADYAASIDFHVDLRSRLPASRLLPAHASRHLSFAHPIAISPHRRPPLNPSLMNSAVCISGWWRHCDVITFRQLQNNKTQMNDCGVIAATPCDVISRLYDRHLPIAAGCTDCRFGRIQRVKNRPMS